MKFRINLSDMTWCEVREYLRENSAILVPVGCTEQHARHLPIGTDIMLAEKVCCDAATEMRLIVAPPISYGITLPIDQKMYGTTTLSEKGLTTFVSEITANWKFQGFKHIILCTFHADLHHIKALKNIEQTFLVDLSEFECGNLLERQDCFRHACEGETSLMLYLYPHLTITSEIEDFDVSLEEFKAYLKHTKHRLAGYDRIGCIGFPSFATKGKGEKIYQLMKANLMDKVKSILAT